MASKAASHSVIFEIPVRPIIKIKVCHPRIARNLVGIIWSSWIARTGSPISAEWEVAQKAFHPAIFENPVRLMHEDQMTPTDERCNALVVHFDHQAQRSFKTRWMKGSLKGNIFSQVLNSVWKGNHLVVWLFSLWTQKIFHHLAYMRP